MNGSRNKQQTTAIRAKESEDELMNGCRKKRVLGEQEAEPGTRRSRVTANIYGAVAYLLIENGALQCFLCNNLQEDFPFQGGRQEFKRREEDSGDSESANE